MSCPKLLIVCSEMYIYWMHMMTVFVIHNDQQELLYFHFFITVHAFQNLQ